MKTVNEVSRQTGVSIRTLHYYDAIGLLRPTQIAESGYRLYDDTALERLQNILLFRELQFPLRERLRLFAGLSKKSVKQADFFEKTLAIVWRIVYDNRARLF